MSETRFTRAADRAREILQVGDRLGVRICGGRVVTVTMIGWSRHFEGYLASSTMNADELHPYNVVKVNGRTVSFRDAEDHDA